MVSRATPSRPWPASACADAAVILLMPLGSFVAVVDAAQLDGALGGLRQRHAGAAAFAEDALVGDLVVLGLAAEILAAICCSLSLASIADGVRRARHGVGGLAAAGRAGPRQVLAPCCPR